MTLLLPATTLNGTGVAKLKALLLMEREVTFNVPRPELLTVNDSTFVCPTVATPKFNEPGSTTRLGTAEDVPCPVNGTTTDVSSGSLLPMVSRPLCVPLDGGRNCTATIVPCPGLKLNGNDAANENTALLLMLIELTVSVAPPTFVIESES